MVVVWSWITLSVETEIAINRKAISHWETVINNETPRCKENTIFNEDSSSSFSSYPDIINPRDHRPRHSHLIFVKFWTPLPSCKSAPRHSQESFASKLRRWGAPLEENLAPATWKLATKEPGRPGPSTSSSSSRSSSSASMWSSSSS